MFSQRNLLDLERPSVILVDHNESATQAAEGIRSTNIVEIIDHHRIDSVETSGPDLLPQSAARLHRDHHHADVP